MAELLQVNNVDKSYYGVHALRSASFSLRPGEVHALMGENGAGKSTLAKIIAGSVRPDQGEFIYDGEPVSIANPLDAQRLGISIIYQELDLFPNLTVSENMAIANGQISEKALVRFEELDRFAEPYLRQVGLTINPRRRVESLNIGEMQLVAIARALSMRAKVIIMDEPTSSLLNDSVERLFQLIQGLKKDGVAVIYVSHKMDEIFRICDRITVMRDGSTIGTRDIGSVEPAEVIRMMVGRPWQAGRRAQLNKTVDPLLAVSNLTTHKLRDVSFSVGRGEVLGIAGLVGAGRSEVGAALVGLDAWKSGSMSLHGKLVKPKSISDAMNMGIRLQPEDRKLDGLMMDMSVTENTTIADAPRFSSFGIFKRTDEKKAAARLLSAVSVKAASPSAPVSSLSGGNQQKVLIARCLLGDPDVIFLDDPTRGIDVGAKEEIYKLIEELAAQGKTIFLVSSELPELLRCANRIIVLRDGSITAELDAAETTQEEIMTFATSRVKAQVNAQ